LVNSNIIPTFELSEREKENKNINLLEIMARKVTQQITDAFLNGSKLTLGNTYCDGSGIYLHGNLIAYREGSDLFITAAGWLTNTTKERLNALPGVMINQVKGQWFLNGKEWDGRGPYSANATKIAGVIKA
jgi:hypothetical protein